MRWLCLLVLCVMGCASTWERHRAALAEHEARGDYPRALKEVRWQIDNAFQHAPAEDTTPAAEAARYLRLSELAVKNGDQRSAIASLREALTADPHQARAVRAQLDSLPVSAAERERLKGEFAWNVVALAPNDDAHVGEVQEPAMRCWSYQVRELRIRHRRTVKTADGMQRQVTYDARPWAFDVNTSRWYVQGDWVEDAGAEAELVSGPGRPRYQAVTASDHEFYADDTVPPCHRDGWRGPFDPTGSGFVAARLPASHPATRTDMSQ